MRNGLSNEDVRPPNMSALTEPEDPDGRVHAAWLAQVSKAGDELLAKEAGDSTSVPTSSSAPADRLAAQEVRVAPAQVDRRPGLTTKILIGSILAAALAAIEDEEARAPRRRHISRTPTRLRSRAYG